MWYYDLSMVLCLGGCYTGNPYVLMFFFFFLFLMRTPITVENPLLMFITISRGFSATNFEKKWIWIHCLEVDILPQNQTKLKKKNLHSWKLKGENPLLMLITISRGFFTTNVEKFSGGFSSLTVDLLYIFSKFVAKNLPLNFFLLIAKNPLLIAINF